MSIEEFIQVTVIAPCSIRISEPAVAGTVGNAAFKAVAAVMSVRTGMSMETGAVTRDGSDTFKKTGFPRGTDTQNPEKFLKIVAIRIRKRTTISDNILTFLSNRTVGIRKFAVITNAILFIGSKDFVTSIGITVTRKDIVDTEVHLITGLSPETVLKIVEGTNRWHLIGRKTGKSSEIRIRAKS